MATFSHRQLFSNIYSLHSKFTPFSLYFSFFVSVSALFHVFFYKTNKKQKNSPLIIGGGQKRGLPPILNIGERVPGLPPRVYAYASENEMGHWTPTGVEPRGYAAAVVTGVEFNR